MSAPTSASATGAEIWPESRTVAMAACAGASAAPDPLSSPPVCRAQSTTPETWSRTSPLL
ncbi:hypothetical protein ASD65_02850 [Microbacterium sp. Root61]|nr:hypothetical protein ASD65_02850 [Microbacterium sp. Root61]